MIERLPNLHHKSKILLYIGCLGSEPDYVTLECTILGKLFKHLCFWAILLDGLPQKTVGKTKLIYVKHLEEHLAHKNAGFWSGVSNPWPKKAMNAAQQRTINLLKTWRNFAIFCSLTTWFSSVNFEDNDVAERSQKVGNPWILGFCYLFLILFHKMKETYYFQVYVSGSH